MNRTLIGILAVLTLTTMSHAAGWQGLAGIAVITSACMLALIYMIGFGFGINELMMTSKEEAYQLVVVMALIGGFVLIETGGDALFGAIIGQGTGMQMMATSMTASKIAVLGGIFGNIADAESRIAKQGTMTLNCNILGVGQVVSGCGGYSMVSPALSGVEATVGLAIAELSSLTRLMGIGMANSFSLLLPIGIIFRTFKLTRGAGGLIIGVAVALYFVLPLSMISMWQIADQFKDTRYVGTAPYIEVPDCEPAQTSDVSSSEEGGVAQGMGFPSSNAGKAMGIFMRVIDAVPFYLFPALIYGIITPAIALLITVASIRVLSALGGAEVDVSVLSRVI